jgi:uncharacterized protein
VFFSVRELELRKAHFDVSFPPGEIEFYDHKLRQISPLKAEGSVELLGNTLGEIRVQGRLEVTMEADCDRCLEAARLPVATDFDLFYRPDPVRHANEEIEIDEGESQIAFYKGEGLELSDILREHILLSLPMQRVCSEACKGICPSCGQNRNQGDCGCTSKPVDDRWAALKKLSTKD